MTFIERPYTRYYENRFLSGIALLDTIENFLDERLEMININSNLDENEFRKEMDFLRLIIELKAKSHFRSQEYLKELENLFLHEKRKEIFLNEGDLDKLSEMMWEA